MKRMFTVYVILFCYIFLGGEAFAKPFKQKDINPYWPTVKGLYEDCKNSLKNAEKNPKTFFRSYCAAEIHGTLSGIDSVTAVIPTNHIKEPCLQKQSEVHKNIDNIVCIPDNLNNQQFEMKIAQDFINFYENHFAKNNDHDSETKKLLKISGGGGYILTMLISTGYTCKPLNK